MSKYRALLRGVLVMNKLTCSGLVLAGVLLCSGAQAAEGGMGVYLLGIAGPQAGYLPDPGTYGRYDRYQHEAWSRNVQSVSAARERVLDHPGPGGGRLKLSASADVDARARAKVAIAADIVTALHVFEADVLGGHPAVALIIPYIDAEMDLDARVDAVANLTLTTPRGRQRTLTRSASRDGSARGSGATIGGTP